MRNKSYIEKQLDVANTMVNNLINDLDNNRPYVTKEYLIERLEQIKKSIILTQDRVQLENENS